jgi:hypothetical protein
MDRPTTAPRIDEGAISLWKVAAMVRKTTTATKVIVF